MHAPRWLDAVLFAEHIFGCKYLLTSPIGYDLLESSSNTLRTPLQPIVEIVLIVGCYYVFVLYSICFGRITAVRLLLYARMFQKVSSRLYFCSRPKT